MREFFEKLTLILILFPYIKIGIDFGTDVQPLYLISAFILLLLVILEKRKIEIYNVFLFVLLVIMIINTFFLFMFSDTSEKDAFGYFRSLYKYLAFLIIFLIYKFIDKELKPTFLVFATVAYFIVSNMQMIFRKPLVGFLVSTARYVPNRNLAIGLTPEPSFLAKFSLSAILLSDYLLAKDTMNRKTYMLIFLMNVEMILISLSLSGIFLLVAYITIRLLLYLVVRIRPIAFFRFVLISLLLLTILLIAQPYIHSFFMLGRLGTFYRYVISGNAFAFFREDVSFQERVYAIDETFRSLLNHPFGNASPQLIGGFMSLIYENGIYGVLFVAYYIYSFLRLLPHLRYEKKQVVFSLVTMYLIVPILIFVDTLSVSYFIVLINILFYNSSEMVKQDEDKYSESCDAQLLDTFHT